MSLWFLGKINKQYKGRGLYLSETFGLEPNAELVKSDYLFVGVKASSFCSELPYSVGLEGDVSNPSPTVLTVWQPLV